MARGNIFNLANLLTKKQEEELMRGIKGEELLFTAREDKVSVEKVLEVLKNNLIDLRALNIRFELNLLSLNMVTSDNHKAKEILADFGEVTTKTVIIVESSPHDAHLAILINKLKSLGINIFYLYGISSQEGKALNVAFSCSDNDKALEVINSLKW